MKKLFLILFVATSMCFIACGGNAGTEAHKCDDDKKECCSEKSEEKECCSKKEGAAEEGAAEESATEEGTIEGTNEVEGETNACEPNCEKECCNKA